MAKPKFLFEVSWEVCNKVGGIYTVLRSKLKQVTKNFNNNYILIGPLLEQSREFVESSAPEHLEIKRVLQEANIGCKVGYWDVETKPTTILLDFRQRYRLDVVLYALWTDFGVDSLNSDYDYQEPALFSTVAGEVVALLAKNFLQEKMQVIGHFHEWVCGAGLLYLKKHYTNAATVFTTHATILARSLSSQNRLVYNLPLTFDAPTEARKQGVFDKFSLEKACAREADCFTTVSNVTADEANIMLGKYPDVIVLNGLDVAKRQQANVRTKIAEAREKLLQIASKVIGRSIDNNALIWATGGRYEFHNKGYDVFLRALANLESVLPQDAPPIVVFLLIAAAWHVPQDSLLDPNAPQAFGQKSALGIATHAVYDADNNSFIRLINELNLKQPYRKIHVVFSDTYLNCNDGVFDISYEQIIAACDLTAFPSYYEPWGYTPLESIAYSVPTITSDLAGFGYWVNNLKHDYEDSIYVLKRKTNNDTAVTAQLTDCLLRVVKNSNDPEYVAKVRKKAFAIATLADWEYFYQDYLEAYDQAIKFNELYYAKFDPNDPENKFVTSIHEAETTIPRFRSFQYECTLPEGLCGLRTLAYNFWWSWHEEARLLFQKIDPITWETSKHNPVYFLNLVSPVALQRAADNKEFVWFYNQVLEAFERATRTDVEIIRFCSTTAVSEQHPIAYFCMEYGIDECLPIYSGGLGILAGDYLKGMSDLKVPMVAVGLFYKQGYFHQTVNSQGDQVALYETWDTNQIPMRPVNDSNGKLLLTTVQILERTVYIKSWEVKVGHVNLYLLDTNVAENTPEDREITNSLYGGSREVRLMQEIVLGIGGTRFLTEKLNIKPCLYHLNEGHSAFLLLERVRGFCHQGMSLEEACEAVRYSSIFTTHTPVPAGNETFTAELIRKYFANSIAGTIGLERILKLAQDVVPNSTVFSMTALALRLTANANAVSTLHGYVARSMWQGVWPGLLKFEVTIDVVTNGVHLDTWVGSGMKVLYTDYLMQNWARTQDDPKVWGQIQSVPDAELWRAHQTQKEKAIEIIKQLILQQYTLRDETKLQINASLNCLNSNVLLLGLSRRFTSYKRNDLILRDKERLARILTNEKRPIVMLISGKAHPADGSGRDLIRSIIETLREPRFEGHIIFLEEYNIGLAKTLMQGVDVWINTPILGREACGTSGMKVGVNGGLNFSTKDGWWDEAYNSKVGWQIESLTNIDDIEKRNDVENAYLLNTLEAEIAPLYYDKGRGGFSRDWVKKMKDSIALIACQYNTTRMARDYINNLYCPTVLQNEQVSKDNYADLKAIVAWKQSIIDRFNTVKIKAILVKGIKDGKITMEGLVQIKVLVFSGKLSAHELKVECILIKNNGLDRSYTPTIVPLKTISSRDSGVLTYVAEYQITDTGFYSYGIRIYPYNGMLFRQQDAGVVVWG